MLVLSLLMGCAGGGAWLNDDLACDADVYDWWGNLTYWSDRGEVEEGANRTLAFDLEPGESWINRVNGSYNTANGNFTYSSNFANGYWLNKSRTDPDFDNFGTVYKNGNLDVRAKIQFEDKLGETFSQIRREERQGCTGEIRVRYGVDVDGEEFHPKFPQEITSYTIATDNRVDFTREDENDAGDVTYSSGFWKSDFTSYVEGTREDGGGGLYEFSTDTDSTDKATTAWTYQEDDLDWSGDSTRRPDGSAKGSYLVKYQGDDYVTIATDLAYDGAGTGTETWHRTGDVCTTTFYADGVCERDCSGDCYTEP